VGLYEVDQFVVLPSRAVFEPGVVLQEVNLIFIDRRKAVGDEAGVDFFT